MYIFTKKTRKNPNLVETGLIYKKKVKRKKEEKMRKLWEKNLEVSCIITLDLEINLDNNEVIYFLVFQRRTK